MKKIYFFILLSFIINSVYCKNTENSYDYLTNNQSTESFGYKVKEGISLRRGFSFAASGIRTLKAIINPSIVCELINDKLPNSFEELNPGTGKNQAPVGAISGSASVSSSGAVNYQIPIFVSPGTAVMAPELSIVYNSQSGDGLLGKGWHLAGLSQIRLDNNISYLDGFNESVKFNLTNLGGIIRYKKRYSLDGQRLICVNGEYGEINSEYRTETESFKKIEYKNNYFIVTDKNGIKSYYGNSYDSKVTLGSSYPIHLVMCNVNKIEDTNGNYMTFEYCSETEYPNNEKPIKRIRYTGNSSASLGTYNEIYFFYTKREDAYKKQFGNIVVDNAATLSEIHIKNDGNIIKKYKFNYSQTPYTCLSSIIEQDATGKSLKATEVKWGNKDYTLSRPSNDVVFEVATDIMPNLNNFFPELITPLTGDFNGDGIHDFAIYFKNNVSSTSYTNGSVLKTFYGKSSGGFNATGIYEKDRNYNIATADVNYDGKDEFVLTSNEDIGNSRNTCYYSLNGNTYSETPLDSMEFRIVSGNFYGNGKPSYVTYTSLSPNNKWNIWHFNDNNQIKHDLVPGNITSFKSGMYENALNQYVDFDGDGTTDILAIRNNFISMNEFNTIDGTLYFDDYSFNFNGRISASDFTASNFNDIFKFADFNGDGKTDLLKKVDNELIMYPSTGLGFSTSNGFEFNPSFSSSTYKFYAVDMNGDGIADIVEMGNDNGQYKIIINLSKGLGKFEKITYISPSDIEINIIVGLIFGDFNGDGKTDIIYYDCNKKYRVLYFMQNDESNLVTQITNGMGFKNEFTYKPANSIPKKVSINKNIRPLLTSTPIVSTVKESTGTLDPMKTITYFFYSGRVHVKGKGFNGFEEIKIVDDGDNITTLTTNQFDPTYNLINYTSTLKRPINTNKKSSFQETTYLIKEMTNSNHLVVLPKRVKFRDYLLHNENLTETEYNYHNETSGVFYGNIKYISTNYSGLYTIISSTFNYSSAGTWCPSRPESITEERTQNGQVIEKETQFEYDSKGNISSSYYHVFQDNRSESYDLATIYTYDNFGNVLTKTLNGRSGESSSFLDQQRKTIYQYDSKGRFIEKETDPEGLSVVNTYNSNFGTIASYKDNLGNITSYEYDSFGNLKKITYPTGQVCDITRSWAIRDSLGIPSGMNVLSTYSIESVTTGKPTEKIWYDLLGREVRVRSDLYNKQTNVITQYNKTGSIHKTSLPFFENANAVNWQEYEYDICNRKISFKSQNLTTRYTYSGTQIETTYPDGNIETKSIDKAGQMTSISSNNGSVLYEYNAHGKPKKISTGDSEIIMEYDNNGNQSKMIDPNMGETTYLYNSFGELIKKIDANGNTITMTYTNAGKLRVKDFLNTTYSVSYTYYTDESRNSGRGGLLKKESMGNGNMKEYEYDDFGNITKMTETISRSVYTHTYTYDENNNLATYTYPSGFTVRNEYTNGFLTGVYNGSSQIWKLSGTDYITEMGQIKNYYMGPNNISTTYSYNDYFELSNITTSYQALNLYNYDYIFDHAKGNLTSRRDQVRYMTENFSYDNCQRLTDWWKKGYVKDTIRYNNSGNITSKSGTGTYSYNSNKPHAVEKLNINVLTTKINLTQQNITYTPFLKTATINEGDYSYTITYGPDQERKITKLFLSGELQKTKIYSGLYERETIGTRTKERHYIPTGNGNAAVNIKYDRQRDTTYYIIRDHLGSIAKIVRPNGTIAEENSYDPWGNLRNPADWSSNNVNENLLLGRGYTGHEHLPEFKLINMNGRMYDPVIARVLSPDEFVQDPNNAQNYNRYTYCLNNPLKYKDPSGWLYDGYTIDVDGNIEWVDDTGGDRYDVLYNKDEYYNHPEKRGYYDYRGEGHNIGIRIDDTNLLSALVNSSEYKQQAYPDLNKKMAWKEGKLQTIEETKTMLPSYYGTTKSMFDARNLFRFAASNSTVEWSVAGFQNGDWLVGTLKKGSQTISLWNINGYSFDNIIYKAHSHGGSEPSYNFVPSGPDLNNARSLLKINKKAQSYLFMPQNPDVKWLLLK